MLPTYSSLLVKNGRSHESGLHLIDVIFWPMRKQHINERSYILAYILRRIFILQAYHRQCWAEGPQVRVFVKPSTTLTTPVNLSRLLKKLSENIYQNKIQGLFQRFPVLSSRNRNTETLGPRLVPVSESDSKFQGLQNQYQNRNRTFQYSGTGTGIGIGF